MKYRDVERVLLEAGFTQARQKGSHRIYTGVVGGIRQVVTLAPHLWGDDVNRKTLASIVRQSGLPKSLFQQ